jgi:hypothetical protein
VTRSSFATRAMITPIGQSQKFGHCCGSESRAPVKIPLQKACFKGDSASFHAGFLKRLPFCKKYANVG